MLACPLTCCFARVLCVLDRSRVARAAHDQINYEEFVKMMMCVSPNSPPRPAPPLAPACLLPTARPPCRSLLRRPARACARCCVGRRRRRLTVPLCLLTGPSKRVAFPSECPVSYLFPCHTNTKSYSPAGTERRGSTCARPAGPTPPASRHKKATLSRTAACLQSTGSVRQQCVIDCVRLPSVPWIW